MLLTSDLKHETIYKLLRRRVAKMQPGSKLPSLRDLMKEYQVSQLTIDKAKELLVNEGLIYNTTGKGTFVSGKQETNSFDECRRLILAIPDWETSFFDAVISSLRRQLTDGQELDIIKYSSNGNALNMIKAANPDAFFMIPAATDMTLDDLSLLNSVNCPFVIIDRAFHDVHIDCVYFDSDACGEEIAKYFIDNGHTKLAILVSEPHVSTIQERVMGFTRYASAMGIDFDVIDCQVKMGEDPKDKAFEVLDREIKAGHLNATALFVVSDPSCMGALKALHDNGVKIPAEVSIMGCGGAPEGAYFYPPLSTISYNYDEFAETAFAVLSKRISENPNTAIKEAITPSLLIRESTCPII